MNVRTNVNTGHLARLALIGCFTIGFSLYCLYDGFVGYPNQQMRANAFIKYLEEQNAIVPRPDKKDIYDHWKIYAAEKNWQTEIPKEPKTDTDIALQFIMAGVTGTIGLFFLVQLLRWRRRWIEAIDTTITSNRGHEFTLDQIIELDKKKWDKKGIGRVKFQTEGRAGQLIIDDCNYERDTTQKILRHIEANIDLSKIVNSKPEPPLKTDENVSPDGKAT